MEKGKARYPYVSKKNQHRSLKTVTCEMCGKQFETYANNSYTCESCNEKIKRIKAKSMVDKAVSKIVSKKRERVNENKLDQYADILKTKIESGEYKFGSVPEVLVALQLLNQGARFIPQATVGDITVDFLLPDDHYVLEVDGSIYHTDDTKQFLRDRRLMAMLGEKWEIIHISADEVPDETWYIYTALPSIVKSRNEEHHFRDSSYDQLYLTLYNQHIRHGARL